jgi:lipopolysaccharide transport system ATP-binding protein
MSSEEIAVRVQNLSKCYEIYGRPQDRLKQSIYPRLRRLAGQTPNKYYREFWALKDISFEVKQGETVGIIGRNGSGKSTLLQIICGMLAPTSGTVETNGRVAAVLELGSGFNPEFTGRENVFMNGAVLGHSQQEIDARFDDIAAFADIGQFIEQPVKTYSTGMYARLAFAVAVNVQPEILVVDETLSVGDEAFQRKCFARINEIRELGVAVLFVSHSAAAIVELCDRAVLMEGGKRTLSGVPKVVVSLYQKLLYASPDRVEAVIHEIRQMDEDENAPPAYGAASLWTRDRYRPDPKSVEDIAEFENELRPQSTVEYARRGAQIRDVHVEDMQGRRVNVLVHGQRYRYCFGVDFDKTATNVGFGMMLKTVTGLEVSGQGSHAISDGLPFAQAGQSIEVAFEFCNLLMPGTYFGNAGVSTHDNGLPEYLHRIIDAVMFRVKQVNIERPISGYINLAPAGGSVTIHAVRRVETDSGQKTEPSTTHELRPASVASACKL